MIHRCRELGLRAVGRGTRLCWWISPSWYLRAVSSTSIGIGGGIGTQCEEAAGPRARPRGLHGAGDASRGCPITRLRASRPSTTSSRPSPAMGHEVQQLGISEVLRPDPRRHRGVRSRDRLQSGRGVPGRGDLRPERGRLPRAARHSLHGLQPARPGAHARQGAVEEADEPTTAFPRRASSRCASDAPCVGPSGIEFPLIVKSQMEEGSMGISKASLVQDDEKLAERVAFVHEHVGTDAIVEEFIDRSRAVRRRALGNERLQVLPPLELMMRTEERRAPDRHREGEARPRLPGAARREGGEAPARPRRWRTG